MEYNNWETAVRPKVKGSWNIHNQLSGLDFFVMLSSLVGVSGNPSQGNYAAGGTFQDALARHRTAQGLPAVTIDLGMVKSVGVVAETAGIAERLTRMGYKPLEEDEVLAIITSAIKKPIREQHASQIITGIAAFDDNLRSDSPWRHDLRFSGLKQIQTTGNRSTAKKDESLKGSLSNASSEVEATDTITLAIIAKLSDMFMIPEAEIDKSMSMARYGVDSLVAVELRNWLVAGAQAEISIFDVLQSPSLSALAGKVAAKSKYIVHIQVAA
jgi:hypothetical protein